MHRIRTKSDKIIVVRTYNVHIMCHRAKFHKNRLNRGRDMVIFIFFKMAATAVLDFQNFNFLTVKTVKRVELHHCAKFRRNRSNRDRDIEINDFSRWRPPPCRSLNIFEFLTVEKVKKVEVHQYNNINVNS